LLSKLTVSNLAVVEKAEAEFASGLNVLTGETGAGKSVLMGALELVLGGRADAGVVRDGAAEAEVEAVFAARDSRLAARDANHEPRIANREIIIRRTVTAAGRSRAWINDESVSLGELKEFGASRVDIHGPRANQKILEEGFQREALDAFGGVKTGAYEAAYAKYSAMNREYEALAAKTVSEDELDMLRYQVNEIEAAGLTPEDETLGERHAAAAHAADIVAAANEITEGLGGDRGAAETLARLQPLFASAARHFPAAAAWARTAEDLTIGIQELSRTVADAVASVDADPAVFEELDARLALVNKLKRKYGDPLAKLTEKKARLDEMEHRGERLEALVKSRDEAKAKVVEEGAKLTAKRKAAATQIAKRVTKELGDLGFRQAKFAVAVRPTEPGAHGCDRVTYMFEPNPGEQSRPLSDVASSGETARVMLAIKEVLAEHDATELLVFDEIDANIGGEIGAVVGAKMREVAKSHQVIAITHLPQSAAFGERHLVVSKGVSGGRTRTNILTVEGDARVGEIARMLGGEHITSVVRNHAEELLGLSR